MIPQLRYLLVDEVFQEYTNSGNYISRTPRLEGVFIRDLLLSEVDTFMKEHNISKKNTSYPKKAGGATVTCYCKNWRLNSCPCRIELKYCGDGQVVKAYSKVDHKHVTHNSDYFFKKDLVAKVQHGVEVGLAATGINTVTSFTGYIPVLIVTSYRELKDLLFSFRPC